VLKRMGFCQRACSGYSTPNSQIGIRPERDSRLNGIGPLERPKLGIEPEPSLGPAIFGKSRAVSSRRVMAAADLARRVDSIPGNG
jgi:hypothetical protein